MSQESIWNHPKRIVDTATVDQLSVLFVLLLGGIFYFRNLGTLPLEFWDESIYANAAANMVDGNWLIPRVA
jgi:4-amino-4-deoxy-L-arabinose transferase-like glycosyltransferase